jgi:hypothetical protein
VFGSNPIGMLIQSSPYTAHIELPVCCVIGFRRRFIHFKIIWMNKSSRLGLFNKANEIGHSSYSCLAVYSFFNLSNKLERLPIIAKITTGMIAAVHPEKLIARPIANGPITSPR